MAKFVRFSIRGDKTIFEGIIINENDDFLTIKLKNGYNVNFYRKNIQIHSENDKSISSNSTVSSVSSVSFDSSVSSGSDRVKIAMIHTGGTIASKVDYRTGAVSTLFSPEELISLFPELSKKVDLDIFFLFNIFSEDFTFKEYNLLIEKIFMLLESNKYDGIIIGHGTDTLHYTSAALQYALKNLPIPVLLVGAQRSSDRPSSDAFSNLNAAADFIISQKEKELRFRRVGAVMHKEISDDKFLIYDGLNLRKSHSTRRDAFKQINYLPYAELRYNNGKLDSIRILREELNSKSVPFNKFSSVLYDPDLKIGFLKVHPNLSPEEILSLSFYDALIVEGTGVGNIPKNVDNFEDDGKIFKAFNELVEKGVLLIAGTQTIGGEVSLDIYSRGRDIQNLGFLGNRMNLISETLFVRVAYILSFLKRNFGSLNFKVKEQRAKFVELWKSNLEGFVIESRDYFKI